MRADVVPAAAEPVDTVRVDAGLSIPHLPTDHGLGPILAAAVARRVPWSGAPKPGGAPPWNAEHFGLDRVALFRAASADQQRRVVDGCAASLLEEACVVEKLGLAFTAKMVLLSETLEERTLYSLFAADEAIHVHMIAAHLPAGDAADADHPFLRLLADVIETGGKCALTYLIQVVLEGWGLRHYQAMARDCRSPALRDALRAILKDEALHHGSGVALFDRQVPSGADRELIVAALVRIIRMAQAGPQSVVARLEGVLGQLPRHARRRVFEELNPVARTRQTLELLRALATTRTAAPIVAALERYDMFRPLTPDECAGGGLGETPRSPS